MNKYYRMPAGRIVGVPGPIGRPAMYQMIMNDTPQFPPTMAAEAVMLLEKLLDKNPATRLTDPNQIKRESFFTSIDWERLFKKQIAPPFVPSVSDPHDTSQIDPAFTNEPAVDPATGAVSSIDQSDFEDFTFVADTK